MTNTTKSITGREGYITLQALAYAIEAINLLPEMWQEASNAADMQALMENLTTPSMAAHLRLAARSHLTQRGLAVENGELVLAPGSQK